MEILVAVALAGFGEHHYRLFESELKEAVIPFVEKNYRTANGCKQPGTGRFIIGRIANIVCRCKKYRYVFLPRRI